MNYMKISLGIFVALATSRFIPHPPNFTSLIALSFYIPALLGNRYIPALIISFAITDLFLGFHTITLFTWGSVLFIGLLSKYFIKNIISRIIGALLGACIFFIITNFSVWFIGEYYPNNFEGLILCYIAGIPFFKNTLISTILYTGLFVIFIETTKNSIIGILLNKNIYT